jgi:type IV pilus assembly protein PilE
MNTLGTPRVAARRSMLGVTLLELMAVILVIGILSSIAIPSYRQYMLRAQRAEAKSALLQLQTNQERFYLTNRTYGTAAQLIAANLLGAAATSERGTYDIAIPVADATTYTATATPRPGATIDMTVDTRCTSFSITAQGVRTATGSTPDTCW